MYESDERYVETEPRWVASYIAEENQFTLHDPVWGECVIGEQPGDEVLLELLDNDLVRRSMAVEQLTLDRTTATIPGTAQFPRWEHIWGSVALVRRLSAELPITPRERLILQLRTFVSDLGQTAYSHLGDWMFQGFGGQEDQHDNELMHLVEVSGIGDTLRLHDIQPEEVVFPAGEDWVECPAPDLCIDRVDYGVREIKRWPLTMATWEATQPDAFTLRDGAIVMRNRGAATALAKSFLLLASEHWSEPVHRLQLHLQEMLVRDVLRHEYLGLLSIDMGLAEQFHPRDLLFSVDGDLTREMHLFGGLGPVVLPLMQDIGAAKRRVFTHERRDHLALFLSFDTADYPDPLTHYGYFANRFGKLPLLPAYVDIRAVDHDPGIVDYGNDPNSLDVYLPALKPRAVDPLFIDDDGEVRRLSTVDSNFAALLRQQTTLLRRAYVAKLYLNTETKRMIVERSRENQALWSSALQRPRMSPDVFRRLLRNTTSVAGAYRMIDLHWYR